jgi:hypothetical protein
MKARVISTRRIVDVVKTTRTKKIRDYFGGEKNIEVVEYYDGKNYYTERELEFEVNYDPDYWTRLEHQYAGMAMQGILSMPVYGSNGSEVDQDAVIECAMEYAHALVEELKNKEERK